MAKSKKVDTATAVAEAASDVEMRLFAEALQAREVYVVADTAFDYNDEYYIQSEDGVVLPVAVHLTKENAERVMRQRNIDTIRKGDLDDLSAYVSDGASEFIEQAQAVIGERDLSELSDEECLHLLNLLPTFTTVSTTKLAL